ncbi:MAG TPA: YceI family protein [Candidatus Limnocylindrales bacterium]|nr:YceI family protein [Candidatus Limnocylindrales bacterium]
MTRPRILVALVILLFAGGVGAYIAYDQVLSGDSAAPLAFPSASAAAGASGTASAGPIASAATSADPAAATAPTSDGIVSGTWTVTTGTEAGYRVRERLANLDAESDAIGRTKDVTGSITLTSEGSTTTLTAGTIEVNTTTITSDKNMRDNRLRREGLQTDTFPTASFTLTKPVEVPAAALAGTATDVTLVGDLTLHGVTKSVEIPAQAKLADGTVQVLGSIGFPLADYDITAPNIGGFIVSIADQGTLEFVAVFAKG